MENPEEILQCLEEFSKIKPKDIPRELEEYLCFVAKTGNPVYQWPVIKCLFRQKLINVISEFYETCPAVDIPPCLNVDLFNYNTMKTFILEKLDTFVAAPFTVQRICELLTTPRKQYNRIDKYMRALEKNILVVSTTEPVYRSTENGDNNNQAIVNGLESDHLSSASSDDTPNINIEEMDDTPPHNTPNSPQPAWSTPNRTHTNNTIVQSQNVHTGSDLVSTTATSSTEDDADQEDDNASSTEDSTSDEGEILAQAEASVTVVGVFGGVEEEAGSSEEEEEEERLLLGVSVKKDEKKNDLHPAPTNIVARSTSVPEDDTQSTAIINASESSETSTKAETLQECCDGEERANNVVKPSEMVLIESADNALVEGVLIVQTTAKDVVGDDKLDVMVDCVGANARTEQDGLEAAMKKDGDSDNMIDKSDIKLQILETPTEDPTETINKLPTENLDAFAKIQDSAISAESTETTPLDILPKDSNILETSDVDIDIKSDREDVKIDLKNTKTSEIIDKESDIEKHESCAIAKEAEKLETEVTQMENIPEIEIDVKVEEKPSENVGKIEEAVANAEEVANVENNVEQDERMEVDDDTLPNILEATSASL